MGDPEKIKVEVVYALPDNQMVLPVTLEPGATIGDAIEASGLASRVPEIDLQVNKVGVFGKVSKLDHELWDGDRVEVYRPLIADPKAAKKKKKSARPARK